MLPRLPRGFTHPMRIGTGAFASVFRVRQSALDRKVAFKIIHEKNAVSRSELLKEAKTQAKLCAGCVPQVYDAFEWKNCVCMVMEWIRGIPLTMLLQTDLSENERISLANDIIGALAEIHKLGFAHRDLKPENIVFSPRQGLYLVDFGFSKNVSDVTMSSLTTVKGTPAYMAPELWSSGAKTDLIRADIYAAGKILMQVLDGTRLAHFADNCVNVNPQLRPSSGGELYEGWKSQIDGALFSHVWEKAADTLTSEELSRHLLVAATTLLAAERFDEAYWLLVESVEEDGSNHDAIQLLGSFREKTGKSRKLRTYALFGAIMIAGITGAFLFGTAHNQTDHNYHVPTLRNDRFRHSTAMQTALSIGQASLRRDSLVTDKLSGTIMLRNLRQMGHVIILDGDTLRPHEVEIGEIFVPSGSHEVVFYDTIKQLVKREFVTVLPFQTRTVDGLNTSVP